jgi:hypothetical protein
MAVAESTRRTGREHDLPTDLHVPTSFFRRLSRLSPLTKIAKRNERDLSLESKQRGLPCNFRFYYRSE